MLFWRIENERPGARDIVAAHVQTSSGEGVHEVVRLREGQMGSRPYME